MSTNKINVEDYHAKWAIRNNYIGAIFYWKFKRKFIFQNYELGILEYFYEPNGVRVLSNEEYRKLYDERNVHEGNERERTYGKVHETWLKVWTEGVTKTGKWVSNFCRELASMKGTIEFQKELKKHGIYKKDDITPEHKGIALKHLLSDGSTYSNYFKKIETEEITEDEILDIVTEYYSMHKSWQTITEDAQFGCTTQEMKFYMKHPALRDDLEPSNEGDDLFKELVTDELLEFLKTRSSYTENLNLSDAITSLESGISTDEERISLTKQILALYGRKDLSKNDKVEVAKNEAELEQSKTNNKIRKSIITLLRLSDDRNIKIQDYFQKIETELNNEKVN
jgi:hypothetical protein